MRQKYLLYSTSNPFAGYIVEYGKVDPDVPRDGSTIMEYIERRLAERTDLRLFVYPLAGPEITPTIQQTKKFAPVTASLIDMTHGDTTPDKQKALNEIAKAQAFASNLPSWSAVETAVNNIGNLADAKAFLLKLSRVVYWLAKNTEN